MASAGPWVQSGCGEEDASTGREEEASDEEVVRLTWAVPLSQFQVDRSLYHPKPTLTSPIMGTRVGPLTLYWQLSLAQARTEAKLTLLHKTSAIPNLGVRYTAYLQRKDGSLVKLNGLLRQSLASFNAQASALNVKAALARRCIQPGNKVNVVVHLHVSRSRFHPVNILDYLIKEECKSRNDYEECPLGAKLYQQVSTAETVSAEADVEFVCPARLYAHKSVLSAFSSNFKEHVSQRRGRVTINCHDVSAVALQEVLYFIYHRKTSPTLYKAKLNEVLEAARLFNQPPLLKLEVEKLLVLLFGRETALKMWRLAMVYELPLLANMAHTLADAEPTLKAHLRAARHELQSQRLHHSLPIYQNPSSLNIAP